jgi:hypothetical protein
MWLLNFALYILSHIIIFSFVKYEQIVGRKLIFHSIKNKENLLLLFHVLYLAAPTC